MLGRHHHPAADGGGRRLVGQSAAAKARSANGQSCLPGWATTAQSIPLARPSAQREYAAAVWLPGLAAASRPANRMAPLSPIAKSWRGDGGPSAEMLNQPATSW
ncbi:hypothetical protein BN971_01095 [Mycobacterium bohemicum DSM 44277]|uniref:Uncharacterized protein n=1 Tax=Mycobacterium bohemicum DSM 44277 TaxID=1236609 RepID=A0A0U0W4X4_MYCBE|nr:hypothetical protein BN971_01095 [Mycobacterium bohemicum DSM 44277]